MIENAAASVENTGEKTAPVRAILLVEDNPFDTVLIQGQLRKLWPESTVVSVGSLREAYEAYKNRNFDMILLDLNLPDSYGPQMVSQMRDFYKNVPIIVITGIASNITVHEALKLGANNVVPKAQIMDEDFANILEQNAA